MMKQILISGLLCQLLFMPLQSQTEVAGTDPSQLIQSKLLLLPEAEPEPATVDWLIEKPAQTAMITRSGEKDLVISNGLISRTFRLFPNVVSHSLKNLATQEEYIRSPRPEARQPPWNPFLNTWKNMRPT